MDERRREGGRLVTSQTYIRAQIDTWTDRQPDKQTNTDAQRGIHTHTKKDTDRQAGRQAARQTLLDGRYRLRVL